MATIYEELIKRHEQTIIDLQQGIDMMEAGTFRLWKAEVGTAIQDITEQSIARDKETIAVLNDIIAASKARQ